MPGATILEQGQVTEGKYKIFIKYQGEMKTWNIAPNFYFYLVLFSVSPFFCFFKHKSMSTHTNKTLAPQSTGKNNNNACLKIFDEELLISKFNQFLWKILVLQLPKTFIYSCSFFTVYISKNLPLRLLRFLWSHTRHLNKNSPGH